MGYFTIAKSGGERVLKIGQHLAKLEAKYIDTFLKKLIG